MLTSSLYTAYSGLNAASKGIATTSNNIANAKVISVVNDMYQTTLDMLA